MPEDPITQIRRRAFWLTVTLALMAWDLHQIRRLAAKTRQQRAEERAKWAREVNDLDEVHLKRVSELQGEVRDLEARLHAWRGPSKSAEPEPDAPAES